MKFFLPCVAVLLGASLIDASCPNSCSGHGKCGTNEVCSCYNGYGNPDCSIKTCPGGTEF